MAVAALMLLCCVLYGALTQCTLQRSAAVLSVPSLLLPLWGAAVSTGINGIVQLMANWEGCASDVVLLIFGAGLLLVLPVILLVFGTILMMQRLIIVAKATTSPADAACCRLLHRRLGVLQERRWSWEPQQCCVDTNIHLYGRVIVLQYRVLVYVLIDALSLIAVAALGASAVNLSENSCLLIGVAVVTILALQLLVCVVVQPFTTLLDFALNALALALNVTGAALQLALLTNADSTSILTAAAALDLMVLSVGCIGGVVSVAALSRGVRLRWRSLIGHHLKIDFQKHDVVEGTEEKASTIDTYAVAVNPDDNDDSSLLDPFWNKDTATAQEDSVSDLLLDMHSSSCMLLDNVGLNETHVDPFVDQRQHKHDFSTVSSLHLAYAAINGGDHRDDYAGVITLPLAFVM